MLTNINDKKVCKLLYISAIIYDLFYWIKYNKKKLNYFMIFFFICIQLNFQKLQTSALTDATPDAGFFCHFKKRCYFNTVKNSL